MLKIRPEQMALMSARGRERFVEETLRSLPSVFPGDARLRDAHGMRETVEAGIASAARHGITGAREVMLYVFLFIEYGAGFESGSGTRWMGRLLEDPERQASEKLDLIYARLEASRAPPEAG